MLRIRHSKLSPGLNKEFWTCDSHHASARLIVLIRIFRYFSKCESPNGVKIETILFITEYDKISRRRVSLPLKLAPSYFCDYK